MFLNGHGLVEFGEKACGFWPELPCPCELRRQRNLPFRVRSANQTALNKKIKLKKVAYFYSPRRDSFLTTFYQHFTTFLPSKNHVQPPAFSKTPSKTPAKMQKPTPSSPQDFF
jgi:hypothetical protein